MKIRRFLALASLALLPLCSMQAKTQAADDAQMNRFIDGLMAKMTLQEKIGQLNLSVTGTIVTGQAKSSDIAGKITRGEVGGLFNLKGVKNIPQFGIRIVHKKVGSLTNILYLYR